MSTADWQIAIPTGNLVATYRGIRIVIKLGETRNPIEIGWYIGGQAVESLQLKVAGINNIRLKTQRTSFGSYRYVQSE